MILSNTQIQCMVNSQALFVRKGSRLSFAGKFRQPLKEHAMSTILHLFQR